MNTIFLLVGVILLISTFSLVYRIINLVGIAKRVKGVDYDSNIEVSESANKINAILFPFLLVVGFGAIFWYSLKATYVFVPLASEHGAHLDFLFWISMAVCFFVFLSTHLLLFTFPYFYQYNKNRKAYYYAHNNTLEVVWSVIPAIVLSGLVLTGWLAWADITKEVPQDQPYVELEIMGKQFNWHVRYPGTDKKLGKYNYRLIDEDNAMGVDFRETDSKDDFMPGEIHVPKGVNVVFKIRSRDVLHSVFLPHFRQKMDAVPGMMTTFWFKPTKTTNEMRAELNNPNFNYELACTEVCGGSHFAMKMRVVVDEPSEFDKWAKSQTPWLESNPDYLSKMTEKFVAKN
jgi:cytochrome c oxidase subunit 2